MKAIPAIDLREGHVVQLVGGAYDAERVRMPNALFVAARWKDAGFSYAHVVDLDAATGRGSNAALINELVKHSGLTLQVGGGVRDETRVAELLDCGVDRVVVGTRAIEDRAFLERIAMAHPNRIIVAADVRERAIVTRGWQNTSAHSINAYLADVALLPLAGILITAVHVEGSMQGADLALYEQTTGLPLQASGGIATMEDLRALQSRNVSAAILGMALYTDALDAAAVAKEFS